MDLTYRDWKNRKHRDEHLGSDCTKETSKESGETEIKKEELKDSTTSDETGSTC